MRNRKPDFSDLAFLPAPLLIVDHFGTVVFSNQMVQKSYPMFELETQDLNFSECFHFSFQKLQQELLTTEVFTFEAKLNIQSETNIIQLRASRMQPLDPQSFIMLLFVAENKVTQSLVTADRTETPQLKSDDKTSLSSIFDFIYFKQLLKSVPFGMVVLDINDIVLSVNPGFLRLFGFEASEVKGRSISELIIPESYKKEGVSMSQAIVSGSIVTKESRRLHSKGYEIDVLVTGIPVYAKNGITQVFGIYQDNSSLMQIQRELEREKKHFQSTFENLPFGSILVNEAGEVLAFNQAFTQLFDYSAENIQLKDMLTEIVPEGYVDEANEIRQKLFSGNKISRETVRKSRNGQSIDVSITATPLEGLKDSQLYLATYEDISERKKLEKELTEQRRELETMVHFLPGMMYRCDLSRDYWMMFVSFGSNRITGYYPEEFMKKEVSFNSIIVEEYQQELWDQWQEVLEKKTDFEAEYQIRTKDGSLRWVWERGRPVFDEQGNALFLEGYIEDITDFKKLEASLNTEHDLLQALMNNIPDTIYFKDLECRFVRINTAQAVTLGVDKPSDAIGKTDADFFDQQHAEKAKIDELNLMHSGQPLINKQEYIQTSTGWNWFSATKVPVRDPQGVITGLVGISRNITALKKLEQQLLESEANLKRINLEKDKIFSVIAHDLRSPFNSFLLLTEILDNESILFDPDELKNLANSMFKSAKSVSELLENLLSWSTLQRGELNLYLQPIRLKEIVDKTMHYYDTQFATKEIEACVEVDESLSVNADPSVLGTVLRNLISNAIKFTNIGGKVGVKAELADDKVKITVSDNGIGIPKNQQKQLFLFESKGRKGTQGELSSGIGLILVKEFVERLGGVINFESEPDVGTSFFFYLQNAE